MYAREHLKLRHLKVRGRAHAGKNGLNVAAGAVDIEPQFHHALDHILDLLIGGVRLHGNDHHFASSNLDCAASASAARLKVSLLRPLLLGPLQ